jgi:hypothetical protein
MFQEFLDLNKNKIIFGLKWTSVIFTTIVLAAFAWTGKLPEGSLFITVLLFASVLFPIFIIALETFTGYLEFKRTNEILNRYPYNELTKNGFKLVPTNQNSKWLFSQIMLQGYYDDYPMDCEVKNGIFKMIALVNRDNFKKEHLKELKRVFGDSKVEYDWLGIALKYNVNKERLTAYGQLKGDLDRFIQFFKKEELKSWDRPWG